MRLPWGHTDAAVLQIPTGGTPAPLLGSLITWIVDRPWPQRNWRRKGPPRCLFQAQVASNLGHPAYSLTPRQTKKPSNSRPLFRPNCNEHLGRTARTSPELACNTWQPTKPLNRRRFTGSKTLNCGLKSQHERESSSRNPLPRLNFRSKHHLKSPRTPAAHPSRPPHLVQLATPRLTDNENGTLLSLFSPSDGSHQNAGPAVVASWAIYFLLQLCGSLETAEI
jgi:hypothetical protein